jgi:hypothetical protein
LDLRDSQSALHAPFRRGVARQRTDGRGAIAESFMTASILPTTHNGDPAFGLKQRTLARKPDLVRSLRLWRWDAGSPFPSGHESDGIGSPQPSGAGAFGGGLVAGVE